MTTDNSNLIQVRLSPPEQDMIAELHYTLTHQAPLGVMITKSDVLHHCIAVAYSEMKKAQEN